MAQSGIAILYYYEASTCVLGVRGFKLATLSLSSLIFFEFGPYAIDPKESGAFS